jgi:hypothetical protein
MANNFKIVISATDKATASVRKVNDAISKMTRPFSNVQRSASALGKEIGRNPVAKGLKQIGRIAESTAASVAKIAVPMAGLVGFGSIAGLAALVTEWGRLGFEIGKTSATLGMAASDLQSLRGAAELTGVSSEELTGSLKALGDTMEDALFGRNQSAMMLFNRMHIGIHKTAEGSIDAARGFKEIATYISSIKSAQVQGLVARQLGLESALPLLRKGAAGIEELQQKIYGFGGVKSNAAIQAAEQFGRKMIELKSAAYGLKIAIGSALMPALQPMIEQLTQWVSINREAISSKVGEWAKRFGEWMRGVDWDKVASNIATVAHALGSLVEGTAKLIENIEKLGRIKQADFWKKLGLSGREMEYNEATGKWQPVKKQGGASGGRTGGASGDWLPDSGPAAQAPRGIRNNNPGNLRRWGDNPINGGYAVFRSPAEGIAAMVKQLQLYGGRGINTLDSIIGKWAPASENDTRSYVNDVSKQTGFAPNARLDMADAKTIAPLISAMIRHENGQNPYDKGTIDNAVSHVLVEFNNAPPGTTATAKTKTGAVMPVRVNHSLPTLAAG